jgi:hypothetical protein
MRRASCTHFPHWCMNCVVRDAAQCNEGSTEEQVEAKREEVRKDLERRSRTTLT